LKFIPASAQAAAPAAGWALLRNGASACADAGLMANKPKHFVGVNE